MAQVTAEQLLVMEPEEFRGFVDRDIRRDLDAQTAAALRSPTVIDRTYRTLVAMANNTEAQLGARKAELHKTKAELWGQGRPGRDRWIEELGTYGEWRAKTLRFKAGLERHLVDIRRLREQSLSYDHDAFVRRIRDLEHTVERLKAVIRTHRDNFDPDAEPEAGDLKLWEALNEL